jgi:hypothetical protein
MARALMRGNRGWEFMRVSVSDGSSASRPEAVEALKMLLAYAIAEGTELQLPIFVGLLRMANLELMNDAKGVRPRTMRGTEARVAP